MDNEPLAIGVFERSLRGHAEVVAAVSLDEARALLERGTHFDAFVFDLNLDPGSGLDLLAFAREHGYATTPAILVTGTSGNAFVNPAHALHAELLTKPFPPEQLREFVRKAAIAAGEPSAASSFSPDPISAVTARPRSSLADCVEDLRRLFALRQSWATWHAIGAVANDMRANLGPRAVPAAAAQIGQDRVKLYRCAKVAARWSLCEVENLLALQMRNGKRISWRHLIVLASVDGDDAREALLARTLAESLKAPALEQLTGRADVDAD